MPRKASTIAPAVRIRENQRRARTRRKELIDDLKNRIRVYETEGVKVTAQVQEAAREVVVENKRLRRLLANKGVPSADVEAFLKGLDHDISSTVTLAVPGSGTANESYRGEVPIVSAQQAVELRPSDVAIHPVITISSPAVTAGISIARRDHTTKISECAKFTNDTGCITSGGQPEQGWTSRSPLPDILGPVSDCYCPAIESVSNIVQSSETECSMAASILAGFRGHGDVEQARVELGCPASSQCSITNAALLSALDSEYTGQF